MALPLIGFTVDLQTINTFSSYPWYALRQNYCQSVADRGAIPVMLSHFSPNLDELIHKLDGLVITGGAFDIDPSFYGEDIKSDYVKPVLERTKFECDLARKAIDKNMPLLGICGGEQLMNVIFGGTLIQHIPEEIDNYEAHEKENGAGKDVSLKMHFVTIQQNTKLHNIVKSDKMHVNTSHHQAVKKVGKGLKASAFANDGVIEAIEHEELDFCLGVQWHPEFISNPQDDLILKAFVLSTKEYQGKK